MDEQYHGLTEYQLTEYQHLYIQEVERGLVPLRPVLFGGFRCGKTALLGFLEQVLAKNGAGLKIERVQTAHAVSPWSLQTKLSPASIVALTT